jgi:hypothetical protein
MGCDIHCFAEYKTSSGVWQTLAFFPFGLRSYPVFGFLAGVRNYSAVPPIAKQRGLPIDISEYVKDKATYWELDAHSHSWLSVAELAAFDYDQEMEDRRCLVQIGPIFVSCADEPGRGHKTTFREFLCDQFFADLAKLQNLGAERVVFWFDI